MFSAADLSRLESATRILVSPLALADVDTWRHEAMRAVCEALGARTGTFTYPGKPCVIHVYELDDDLADVVNHFTGATWSGTGTSPEPLLDVFHEQLVARRLHAWDMHVADHVLGGNGVAWNNLFHNEVLNPHRLDDTHALFAPAAYGSAMISIHGFRQAPAPGQHLPLLRLLFPAFQAGLDALTRLDAHRASLDLLTEPVAVYSVEGRAMHRNAAFARLVGADPEQARLEDEVHGLVRGLCALGFGRGPADAFTPASRTVQTRTTRYHLRGTLLGPGVFGPDGAVMVTASAEAAPALPPPEALRERFGLTRREAEVALLLAEGLSNSDLADRLYISPHTARRHTEQVFSKLGLTTRKALALRLLQPD